MREPSKYLTLDAAARRLDVTRETLARWIAAGRFPACRTPGGRYRIAAADIEAGLHLEPARKHL